MASESETLNEFAEMISSLYEQIILDDIPERPAYRGYLDRDTEFALDDQGYRDSYLGLLQRVFALPNIADMWSEDGVQELGHGLIVELAQLKLQGTASPDFAHTAQEWLDKIQVEFEEFECYGVVSGLVVSSPLAVGDVTFLPASHAPDLEGMLAGRFLRDLNSWRESISYSKVTAEWRRASQIHREKTEVALNVLRFVASLVWHDQPTRHVYVESAEPKRVSYTLVVSSKGAVSSVGASEFDPLPIELTDEMLPYAQFYGFTQIQSMLEEPSPTEIERAFLTAIQWFGRATQEQLPLVAFIKFYIAIEVALKRPGEHAKSVLPRRIGVLLSPWDKSRLATLERDLGGFIDERNAVFHSGLPLAASPDRLRWDSRILSRQVLHQIRQKLASENWQTTDDLIAWVDNQYSDYLS
jgi:hypothetical protein